ncbi:MAG TPA: adenylosuccinate synthetase [Gemmatimonadales bacterium]|nr:adenylosuccinate synthetase [Gemmatimonadales bacterium]
MVKTHEIITATKTVPMERQALQEAGEALDNETGGSWVADYVASLATAPDAPTIIIIDAVRLKLQIDHLRKAFKEVVTHIHLTATREVLTQRYTDRHSVMSEVSSYEKVAEDPTEAQVGTLQQHSDIWIDTAENEVEDVVARVAARLGLYGRGADRLVDVIVGGQYGSEGKGQIAGFLAPEYDVLVRVGGPNAGHKVYHEDGADTFRSVPSGANRAEHAKLVIGPGAVLRVDVLQKEIAEWGLGVDRLFIDPQAMIVEDWDVEGEDGLKKSIGSTKQGVGFATARKIFRDKGPIDGAPKVKLAKDVADLKPYLRPTQEVLEDAYCDGKRILLEGTQGTALSIHHGSYPYVTSRDTTASGCLAEAGISPLMVRRVIMVCRTYPIRVAGTSGPMGREIDWGVVAARSGYSREELERNERGSVSGTLRRVAEFSWSQLRAAAALNAPTDIALTFGDYLSVENQKARRYDQLHPKTPPFIEEVERVARAPVSLIAVRFDYRSVIDRRHW